ncbi:unnamed protein product [Caenorhabditis sp. 36 PRJEB53466]|nr:unnamed protein product [Caenorhabditis sp. 36 PRJEB53466]
MIFLLSSLTLFSLLFCPVLSVATCHGKEYLDPSGRYCFILHPGEKSFHDAEKACYDYGGYHLAAVTNMIDNNFLYGVTRNSSLYINFLWLGLTDMTADGGWDWIDGTDLVFMNWSPVSSPGHCGTMRTTDGRWQAHDCSTAYPFFCYGKAQGAPTDPPAPPRTTAIPTRKEQVLIKFMADSESIGDPNIDQNALKFYNNEREFIRAVTDFLFANPANDNNICKFYMSVSFYGYTQYEQQFEYSPAWSQREFDDLLEANKWDDGKTDHAYNITDAISGAQRFRWTPAMEDMGYTTLVFLTARHDFSNVPSLFVPWPKFDEVVVISLNGSKMSIPTGVTNIQVSNDFSDTDYNNVINALKCH